MTDTAGKIANNIIASALIADPAESMQFEPSHHAWATSKGRFWVPTATSEKLPAGVYTVGSSDRIGIFLDMVKVVKDDLVMLPGMGADVVLDEIKKFWDAKAKYEARGVVHKRGIIMHGPPGSGKTSNSELLIDLFLRDMKGIVMLANGAGDMGAGLKVIRQREPDRPVMIVIEDIDSALKGGGEEMLLNMLDGKHQASGVVFVATTNHLEKLPPRIANRPSRFDLVVEIGMPNYDARMEYLRVKEPTLTEEQREQIAGKTDKYSIAHLKELLLLTEVYEMPLEKALERIQAIMEKKLQPDQAAFKTERVSNDFGIQPPAAAA